MSVPCTHSVQLWQLHGQEQAAMPRQRLPHKRSVELPLPLVGVQNRVSHQGQNGGPTCRLDPEKRTLELVGEFSQHLHSFQAETYFPRAASLSRGHKPWAVASQPDSGIQSRESGLSLEDWPPPAPESPSIRRCEGSAQEAQPQQKQKALKTTKAMKRRVELKTLRTQEAQERKLWSKQHGHDTYSDEEKLVDEGGVTQETVAGKKGSYLQKTLQSVWFDNALKVDSQTLSLQQEEQGNCNGG